MLASSYLLMKRLLQLPHWKPTESLTGRIYSNQEKRRRNKMPVHMINFLSVTKQLRQSTFRNFARCP